MNIIRRAALCYRRVLALPEKINRVQEALGRIEQRQIAQQAKGIDDSEFRVFSQWGEDGILQWLLSRIQIADRVFVEFGVENYTESNTRFLAVNNYWSGLVMDANRENINYIKKDPIYWSCNIKAEHAFITRENINKLISDNGISGDIGILSIDIDGNDYWVWEAIDCISPRIVICEYNSLFGAKAKVTVPYSDDFSRERSHFSKVYYGASIAALEELSRKKGYSLVCSNMAGNNVFFVREDLVGGLRVRSPQDAYRSAQFREAHSDTGGLSFADSKKCLNLIKDLQLFNLETQKIMKIKDINDIIAM